MQSHAVPTPPTQADEDGFLGFRRSVEAQDVAAIQRLIHAAPPEQGLAWALQWAAWRGDGPAVERGLAKGVSRSVGTQALVWAAQNGHAAVVRRLVPLSRPKSDGSKALTLAAKNGHAEVVGMLIPVSDPRAGSSGALAAAAQHGHAAVLDMLIPVSDPWNHGFAAILWAAHNGHVPILKRLLPLVNLGHCAFAGLEEAAERGHSEAVALFLQELAPEGLSHVALQRACANQHVATARLLVAHSPLRAEELASGMYGREQWPSFGVLAQILPVDWVRESLKDVHASLLPEAFARVAAHDLAHVLAPIGPDRNRPRQQRL